MFYEVLVCSVGLARLDPNPLLCSVSVLSCFSSTRAKPCVSCNVSVFRLFRSTRSKPSIMQC